MADFQLFLGIMVFYAIISYVLGPMVGYYSGGRNYNAAGSGFVIGSLVSIVLWFSVGQKMINK